jgi:hypothetical protein
VPGARPWGFQMNIKHMSLALCAGVAISAVLAAAPANATVTFAFTPGAPSPSAGFTVIDTFNTATGITGSNFQIKNPPSDGDGATPANSVPAGTPYLSVLGGSYSAFEFDWGSIDTYNTLIIHGTAGDVIVTPGAPPAGNFPNAADGNQFLPGTNGLFIVSGTAGEKFTGITLTSSQNSFEVDNLAVAAVPEPASWALMIVGFGLAGGMVRANRRNNAVATA